MAKRADKFTYIIGLIVIGFIAWQLIGYILPDRHEFKDGQALLDAVIEESGGMDRWDSVSDFRFEKYFALYDSTGTAEIDRQEQHHYTQGDIPKKEINWETNGIGTKLVQFGNSYTKFVENIHDSTTSTSSVKNSIQAGSFVIGLPFTLNDPSAQLEYLGLTSFQEEQAHTLKVIFNGSSDVWHLYYDKMNLKWLGYWVKTSDHFSLIVNETMQTVTGITLPRKRISYRTDSDQEITYIRARYDYTNFDISLKE